jgi:ankyrin repeat protein
VCLLLERGAEVDLRDWLGQTPLLKASRSGHVGISRALIDRGANVNARKYNYWSPIHYSADHGYLGIVELLIEHGADVHALNDEGQTEYQLSLRKGHRKIADLLRMMSKVRQNYPMSLLRCLTNILVLVLSDNGDSHSEEEASCI